MSLYQVDPASYCSSYQTNHMIEMDQFVHTLSGQLEETIERKSMQSSVTMKEQDGFLNGYALQNIYLAKLSISTR